MRGDRSEERGISDHSRDEKAVSDPPHMVTSDWPGIDNSRDVSSVRSSVVIMISQKVIILATAILIRESFAKSSSEADNVFQ